MNLASLVRPERQPIFAVLPAIAGGIVLLVSAATTQLSALARGITIGCLVASIVAAFLFSRRDVNRHLSIALATAGVAIAGQTRTGAPYVIACAFFVLVMLACYRAPLIAARIHGSSAPTKLSPVVPWRALALLLGVMGVVTGFFVTMLPPAGALAERQVQRWAGNVVGDDDVVGFSTNVRVGSLNHFMRSNRVVMRIGGDHVEYLRGIVFDSYEGRIWSSKRSNDITPFVASSPADGAAIHIEMSRAALSGRTIEPRWFLPDDACNVGTASGRMTVDPYGATHPDPLNDTREIWFRRGPRASCEKPLAAPSEPTRQDLTMNTKVRAELQPIAIGWTLGTNGPREALAAIERHLAGFEYTLEDRREGQHDPVFEFLTITQRGHCELFASALALLARTIGIPTRLVAGYHVDEVNAITGLSVVRDRNAHTWVEAWVGDRWISLDPTPVSDAYGMRQTSSWEDVFEAISLVWDRAIGFFANISLASAGIFSGAAAVALILLRRFLRRRGLRGKRTLHAASKPLPAFESLAAALARAGFVREASEPLERFARRVDEAKEPWSADVAAALARYADLRYGGIGEEPSLASHLEALARKVVTT